MYRFEQILRLCHRAGEKDLSVMMRSVSVNLSTFSVLFVPLHPGLFRSDGHFKQKCSLKVAWHYLIITHTHTLAQTKCTPNTQSVRLFNCFSHHKFARFSAGCLSSIASGLVYVRAALLKTLRSFLCIIKMCLYLHKQPTAL